MANHIVMGKDLTWAALQASASNPQESGVGGAGFSTLAPTEKLVVTASYVLACSLSTAVCPGHNRPHCASCARPGQSARI